MTQKVKSYTKDTNDFLRKKASLSPLSDDIILCTIDVVGLYQNIPHDGSLMALRKSLESREDKTTSTVPDRFKWMRIKEQYFWI